MKSNGAIPGHSIECSCERCMQEKQGVFRQRAEYESKIVNDISSIELLGEVRIYDSQGNFTSRQGSMIIEW